MSSKDNKGFSPINAINHLPSYIFWKDENSVFMGCNQRFANLIGLTSNEEIKGKTDFDISSLEDAKKFIEADKQILSNGQVFESIEKYNDKILKVNKYPMLDEKEKPIGVICIMENYSDDENKLQQHMEHQENKYKLLVENLSEGIWVIDKNFNTAFTNKVMANMLGYDVKDMVGRPMTDFVPKNKIEEVKKECMRPKTLKKRQCETILFRKNGTEISVLVQCSSFFDKENNFKGIIASILDITEKKITEQNLEKKEETYRDLIEFTNTAFFILNKDLNIIQTNKTFSETIGVDIENLIGRKPRSWVCGEDIPCFDEAFSGLLLGRPIKELEMKFVAQDKTNIHLIINANIIINGEKKILCLLRNISSKKEAEAKIFIEDQKQKDRIKQKILELRGKLREDIL